MEKKPSKAERIVAVIVTWSSIALAVYSICIGRWDGLIMAAMFYFIGGMLALQIVRDTEALYRDFKEERDRDSLEKSEYNIHGSNESDID